MTTEGLHTGRTRADRAARHAGRHEATVPPPAPDPRTERIRELEHLIEVERRQIELERLQREAAAARVVPPAAPGPTAHDIALQTLTQEHARLQAEERRVAAQAALDKAARDAATAARPAPAPTTHEAEMTRLREEKDRTAAQSETIRARTQLETDARKALETQRPAFSSIDLSRYPPEDVLKTLRQINDLRLDDHMQEGAREKLVKGMLERREAMKGAPLWKRMALGALFAGAAIGITAFSGGLASVPALAWLTTTKALLGIGGAASLANGIMTGHYLHRRGARNPWIWGAVAGGATAAGIPIGALLI